MNPNITLTQKQLSEFLLIDYLYPQSVRSDWNKVQRNKVRTSISNVLSRKGYLGKYWSRIKQARLSTQNIKVIVATPH